MDTFQIDNNGYYGEFGGAYIPEELKPCIKELQDNYLKIIEFESFQKEFNDLLKNYAGRPSPLYLAKRLSEKYGCRIYLKREDLNHTGSHKINNALGQALIAKAMGKKRVIAETGAGSHGVAAATVCALMNLECTIYMGEVDIERQKVNVERMQMLGAKVVPVTDGSRTLTEACTAALNEWSRHPQENFYILGSAVGPHPYPDMVARLQSVISKEIGEQLLEKEGRDYPDYLVACLGGGSNAAGTIFRYIDDRRVNIVLAEAGGLGVESGKSAATITLGKEAVMHGFRSLFIQDDKGNVIEPYTVAAGLDYPGIGPMHANMAVKGRSKVLAINDDEAIHAAFELSRLEGIVPALESSHAVAALSKISFKPEDIVVLTVSGRGDKDILTYLNWA